MQKCVWNDCGTVETVCESEFRNGGDEHWVVGEGFGVVDGAGGEMGIAGFGQTGERTYPGTLEH